MIKGHSMVYFGPEKWEGMWRNRHHLMSRFSEHNRVLYVEPALGFRKLRHYLNNVNKTADFSTLFSGKDLITRLSKNMHIYHSPLYIPIFGRFPLSKFSLFVWLKQLMRTLSKLEMKNPIIWLSRPNMYQYLKVLNEKMSIYHVVDEYLAYGNPLNSIKSSVSMMENNLIKAVDAVVVVSNALYESKSLLGVPTYVVQNGVDTNAYNDALADNSSKAQDLNSITGFLIGYSGLISGRLNLSLLYRIAAERPDYSIILMGQVNKRGYEEEFQKLERMPNIYFIGSKPIETVPYYIKAFDVCLVPYAINEETRNLDALKFYDYLAAGKPVVTTNIPAVKQFSDVSYISNSDSEFLNKIHLALSENTPFLSDKRKKFASANTWDLRVEQLSNIIEKHI